ncbi:hypothetical protein Bhyg_03920 [Pseudolycoriella hygida]|uniref:Uncharacterized protein n=1 Tax=Pseudolycoriella hygida TaxID=35572 RepID=A0A9Q0NE88_9DIPT|nr:hypothetical protein Bhyg_03920 [Pseudolycoriella hygida]
MEELLKRFLEEIGAVTNIKNSFKNYLKNIDEKGAEYVHSAIVLPLKYEYPNFSKDLQPLLHLLINNPQYYEHVLRNLILTTFNRDLARTLRPFRVQVEQIHFVYGFRKLPLVDEYKFFPEIQKKLSNFTCVVAGRGEVKMYTRQTVWYCEKKCTPNMICGSTPTCEGCLETMKECVRFRDMSEQVKLVVFPLEMVQTSKVGKVYHKFDVILSDDLANFKVIYGNVYVITGIYDAVKKVFNGWNIVERPDV